MIKINFFILLTLFIFSCSSSVKNEETIPDPDLLIEQGKTKEALAAYDKLLAKFPSNDTIRFDRAQLLYDLGLQDEAWPEFQKLVSSKSNFELNARYLLGSICLNKGEFNNAISHFDTLLKSDDKNIWGHLGRGVAWRNINLGVLSTEALNHDLGGYLRAETDFKICLGLDPEFVPALIELGRLYYETGMPDSSIKYYKKVLLLAPENTNANFESGLVYRSLDSIPSAMSAFTKAIALSPKEGMFYLERGLLLLEEKKDTMGACQDINKALEYGVKYPLPAFCQ